ncbi:MAG: glycosyltransferase family 87 protein [Chloroflexota bacterium]
MRVSERRAIGWRGWLAARSNARYALLLLVPIPLVYLAFGLYWSSQFLLQADFTAFYTGATISAQGLGAQLYDLDLQRRVQEAVIYPHHFAVGDLLPFRNPPFALLPFLPWAAMPIRLAYWGWAAVNLLLFVSALRILTAGCPSLRRRRDVTALLWVASFAFLPSLSALLLGQLSFWLLFFWAAGFHFLRRGSDFRAGALLAGVVLKPQLMLVVPLLFLARGRWGALGGLVLGTVGLMATSLVVVGPFDLMQFLDASRETAGWLPLSLDLTWSGLASGLLQSWPGAILPATLAAGGLTLLLLWSAWRGEWNRESQSFSLKLALLLLASMLVSPHLYGHDLVLLIPVGFYTADYLLSVGAQGRTLAVAKSVTVALFLAALLDSYPVLGLPVRPVFLAMLVAGWALFLAQRGARARTSAPHTTPP